MELEYYQSMAVNAMKVCRNARYQNLWWVEEPNRQMEYVIHFWVYWKVLQAAIVKFPRLSTYAATKYQRLIQFAIGPHSIYIHTW